MMLIKSAHDELKEIGYSSLAIHKIAKSLDIKVSKRKIHYILQENTLDQIRDPKLYEIVKNVLNKHKELMLHLKRVLCSN